MKLALIFGLNCREQLQMTQNLLRIPANLNLKRLGLICFLLAALAVLGLVSLRKVGAAGEEKTLRLRSLEIVDAAGVARMRLGAPVPDPATDGKSSPRRSPMAGIQLNDAKGNEIGALGLLDDGSTILSRHQAFPALRFRFPWRR